MRTKSGDFAQQSTHTYLHELENLKNYEAKDIENRLNISDNQQNVNLLNLQEGISVSDLEMKLISTYCTLRFSLFKR